jgi:hypothetical protein
LGIISGTLKNGKGLLVGRPGQPLYTTTTKGAETGRYEIGFPRYRDITINQVGAKIAGIRRHNWNPG